MFIMLFICFVLGILMHIHLLYGLLFAFIYLCKCKKKKIGILFIGIFYFYVFLFTSHPVDQINGKVVASYDYGCIIESDFHYYFTYTEENYDLGTLIKGTCQSGEMSEARNFNAFSFKDYLFSKKVFDVIELENIEVSEHKSIKQYFIDYLDTFSSPVNSYSKNLLLGIKDEYSDNLYDLVSALSLLHLFALSGMHLSLIEKYLLKLHLPKKIVSILLCFYVILVRDSVSLWRSLLQKLLKSYTSLDSLNALSLTGVLLLLYNPYLLYSSSFIFSMVISLVIECTKKMKYSFIYPYLASIPLILYNSYTLPILGVIYGYLCTDLMELIFMILFLNALLLGKLSLMVEKILMVFENILYFLNDFGLTLIFRKPSILFIVIYYLIFYFMIERYQRHLYFKRYPVLLLSMLFACYFYVYVDPSAMISMIDVGQGDCFLIKYPFDHGNVLIDTGGSLYTDLAKTRIIPYLESIGIKKLDYVVITHDDNDHCGALESLCENFKVSEVIKEGKDFLDFKYIDLGRGEDENSSSLVYTIDFYGKTYLFTGDLPIEKETLLCEKVEDIDVLKVGHHGSNTSTSAYLLENLSPSIALISVGKNNLYGHPHQEVIERLEAYGVKIYRTDQDGMVEIICGFDHEKIITKLHNDS